MAIPETHLGLVNPRSCQGRSADLANFWGVVFPGWRLRAFPGLKIGTLGTHIHQSAFEMWATLQIFALLPIPIEILERLTLALFTFRRVPAPHDRPIIVAR